MLGRGWGEACGSQEVLVPGPLPGHRLCPALETRTCWVQGPGWLQTVALGHDRRVLSLQLRRTPRPRTHTRPSEDPSPRAAPSKHSV